MNTIKEMGNPFMHDNGEFLVLDTRDIVEESVVTTVRNIEKLGTDQYNGYHKSVITNKTMSIHNTIKRNALPLYSHPAPKAKSKKVEPISMLKHDVELFSRLYIVMQHRDGDMATFFKHENHPYLPSISDRGQL